MHISFLTPEYPHDRIGSAGGMGTSIKNLVEALICKDNIDVTIFIYGHKEEHVFKERNITFHLIKQKTYKLGGFYFYRKYLEKYINNNCEGIDVLEAPDWTGITAFMNLKRPLVIRFHGSDTYFCHLENRPQKWKNKFFEKNAVEKATALVAPTNYAGEVSMRLFNLSLNKLSVIPYGLQLDNFMNDAPEVYTPYKLLNIGTLIRKKGVFQLVEMFNNIIERYPDAQLTFIGADSFDIKTRSTSTWRLMKKLLSPQALKNTQYLGKVPYHKVQDHIKTAHVCVFPSLAETLGMVTIESMAMSKAVVNTNIGWAQDLIVHGVDGYMHHPDEVEKFVETISQLFDNKDEVNRISKNAYQSVKRKFDINQIALTNIRFYKTIIDGSL